MAGIGARIFAGKKMITCAGPLKADKKMITCTGSFEAAEVETKEPVAEEKIINEVAKVEEPKVEATPVETAEAPVETAQTTSKKKKK